MSTIYIDNGVGIRSITLSMNIIVLYVTYSSLTILIDDSCFSLLTVTCLKSDTFISFGSKINEVYGIAPLS